MVSMNQALDTARSPDLKLFVKDVRDPQARKRAITLRSWSTVKDVKDVVQQVLHVSPRDQRLYFGPLMKELPNHRSLHDAGIYRSGETLLLDIASRALIGDADLCAASSLRASADVCVSSSMIDACPRLLRRNVAQARRGLALGLKPELVLDGSGGTYFLRDARKLKVAVFKPADEEPYAENNPRGYIKRVDAKADMYDAELSLRAGILPGEACLREVAAYLLDHGGFSAVPMTTLAEARHPAFNTNGARLNLCEGGASVGMHSLNPQTPATSSLKKKVGSFQEFVHSECTMDDISPSMISVDEIHKIAILDIRLMNADRNSANLLCKRMPDNSIELVPIDHGYCLRDVCDVSWMDWVWLDWPQLKQPLSEKSKRHVLSIDIDADAKMLKEKLNISGKAIDYFRASSKLLQAGVEAGLSLYDIAIMCCRNDNAGEIPSKLEVLTEMATELASSAVANGMWHHAAASKALADQLSPEGGSLLQSPIHFFKSVSSIDLVSFGSASEGKSEVPLMAQSTGSETSSEDVDDPIAYREACEEWAASVIADVSLDKSMSILQPIQIRRSLSMCSEHSSDTNLSSSPKGFWYRNPRSSPEEEESESEASSLSAHISPSSFVDFEDTRSTDEIEGEETFLSPNDMKHAESFSRDFLFPPPATVNVSTFKAASGVANVSGTSALKPKSSRLPRSHSYSAFSDLVRRSSNISSMSSESFGRRESFGRLPLIDENEKFKRYFTKFVDLVVVRETTAHASFQHVTENVANM